MRHGPDWTGRSPRFGGGTRKSPACARMWVACALVLSGCATTSPVPPLIEPRPPAPVVTVAPASDWQPKASTYSRTVQDWLQRVNAYFSNARPTTTPQPPGSGR